MVTVFAAIIALQLIVAAASIELLSAVRAYVTGESLYSKGQKDAQIHLLDYAQYHREEDYLRLLAALSVPLGDRLAREELQKAQPDLALALRGLLQGGNHPDDIDGMVRLFRWFRRMPFMANAIDTWTDADLVIQQMRSLAERAHQRIVSGDLDATGAAEMHAQALHLNQRLTQLESKFSAELGEASRQTQRLLLIVNSALAALLALTGVGSFAAVRASRQRPKTRSGDARNPCSACSTRLPRACSASTPEGRCTFINRAALQMLGYADEAELLGREIHELVQPPPAAAGGGASDAPGQPRAARRCTSPTVLSGAATARPFPSSTGRIRSSQAGRIHGAVATFFDISDRLTMQAALRQGELRIAKLVDAVTDGVITIDSEKQDRSLQPRRRAAVRRRRGRRARRPDRSLHPLPPGPTARRRTGRIPRRRHRRQAARLAARADRPGAPTATSSRSRRRSRCSTPSAACS